MAINPTTLKAIVKIAGTAVRDERARRVILVACLVPFLIILLVLSSPFAIFFSVTSDGVNRNAISISHTIDSLKSQFQEKIRQEKEDDTVDEVHTVIMGSEDNTIIDNSVDVLIAYSVNYNVNKNAEQMAVLTEEQINELENVFWDMNIITSKIETVSEKKTYTTTNEKDEKITKTKTITKKVKTIYIVCLTTEEIGIAYHFDRTQQRVVEEMKKSGITVRFGNNISKNIFN